MFAIQMNLFEDETKVAYETWWDDGTYAILEGRDYEDCLRQAKRIGKPRKMQPIFEEESDG